jgi:GAF domain-containing protein
VDRLDLADALTRLAHAMTDGTDLPQTLDTIASTVEQSLDEVDHVGISTAGRGGTVETLAATDELVRELIQLQLDADDGPDLTAIRTAPLVTVQNARHDQRWPDFIPRAVQLGLRSQISVRLQVDDHVLGSLHLYSTTSDTLAPETARAADTFAAHVALAVYKAQTEENLRQAVASRTMIGQALGLVMERYSIDEEAAFALLRRASSHTNRKLRDVARQWVDEANARGRNLRANSPGTQSR